ncbi:hypothetical protein AMS68_001037 [Peltaster fructicola]|uniref:C2H2-type domain-containing protein n=1 Tax=Peltaster fructicola TaxID=286661 RepID=A0A6H0XLZ0_9PEZI|nr:hypothetical protein AMS68_001037 [Peltaster fructicola]
MDPSTPQTVAQAIEAATQQQAQQQAQQSQQLSHPSPPLQSHQSSGIDNLVCQWQGCGERLDNAENLYDHVCERHVGRKSTNNLNLTCAWGACRTTTVKRDHITSHIRVHVPLKPHKCDFCGKAFKRPQDLKKHVKTHADDSVLMNSPQPQHNARSHNGNGHHTNKNDASSLNIAEAIQAYMANPRGNLLNYGNDNSLTNNYPAYQSGMTTGPDSSYGHPTSQYAAYGSVSYPSSSAVADIQSMDTRRRAIEALNDFLGDIKRRALNPSTYYDVGQRLQSNALPLPIATGNGYNMGYNGGNTANTQSGFSNSFSNSSLMDIFSGNAGGVQGPMAQQGYSLPIPNARTKTDLQEIDRFLEQLQATVYESSNSAAASGIQQPGVHTTFTNDYPFGSSHQGGFTSSHSPTTQHSSNSGLGSMSSATGLPVSSASIDTPALTPASVSSYSSSGQSPLSSAGRPSVGGNGLYPSLPSVTGISDMSSGYPSTTSAPASGLATSFDELDRRRYSGGRLQRQAPAESSSTDVEMTDETEDGSRTPRPDDAKKPDTSIDPALREEEKSESAVTSEPGDSDDKRQEEWVENIRVIEALRKWIGSRLKNGEFDEQSDTDSNEMNVDENKEAGEDSKTVETAKMAEEQMAEVLTQANAEHDKQNAKAEISYPALS